MNASAIDDAAVALQRIAFELRCVEHECGLFPSDPIRSVEQEHPMLWLAYAVAFVATVALSALFA